MKLDTAVIITKGLCFVIMGGLTPLATGLGQWVDTGEWPPMINWVVIGAGCFVGAATQMLSFLSQSFGNYKDGIALSEGAVKPPTP
jgi:hypothetical protein